METYLNISSQRTIDYRAIMGAYAHGGGAPERAGEAGGQTGPIPGLKLAAKASGNPVVADLLDLGNRPQKISLENIMAILEEKVTARVEARFTNEADEAAPSEGRGDDYWSPENTARRIVDFATKFWDVYSEKHGKSEESLDNFMGIISGAIDQGIGEAKDVIRDYSGGKVPEENASTIKDTRDYIEEFLANFREATLDAINGSGEDNGEGMEGTESSLDKAHEEG